MSRLGWVFKKIFLRYLVRLVNDNLDSELNPPLPAKKQEWDITLYIPATTFLENWQDNFAKFDVLEVMGNVSLECIVWNNFLTFPSSFRIWISFPFPTKITHSAICHLVPVEENIYCRIDPLILTSIIVISFFNTNHHRRYLHYSKLYHNHHQNDKSPATLYE